MVKSIFGGAGISAAAHFKTKEVAAEVLDICLANGVTTLDTARLYAGSEVMIGQLDKKTQFTIDTKVVGGFVPGNVTKEDVIRDAKDSLEKVGIKQFDVLYAQLLPLDPSTPAKGLMTQLHPCARPHHPHHRHARRDQ
jgi:aflatoxin B1 aldehyde reductase